MTRSGKRSTNSRPGFTLVELLVVIGIILILIGLLFPAISAVQKQARASATKQEMSRLQSACNAYYLEFRAYPGPLSENQVYPQQGGCPVIPVAADSVVGIYQLSQNPSNTTNTFKITNGVTSSENLYLGLEGQLIYPGPNSTPVFWYTPPSSGPTGPASLNPANPGVHASYLNYSPKETTYDSSSDGAAGLASNGGNANILPIAAGTATDSSIPEFVDHFSPARPILYMRARVGTTGMLYTIAGTSYPSSTVSTACQYNEQQLQPYGWVQTMTYNPPSSTTPSNQKMAVNPANFPTNSTYNLSDFVYFANPAVTGTPIGKDGYILISAGPDGIYGDSDDIILSD
jgi:prepilin-type N-terminal cleavage/methylation domain-containing protein